MIEQNVAATEIFISYKVYVALFAWDKVYVALFAWDKVYVALFALLHWLKSS